MDQDQVFHIPEVLKQREHILVIGVGGGGGNALNHIIESGVEGVEFVAANTDSRALAMNKAPHKIILGEKLTKGLGAGADPQVGMDAAKESIDHIREYINGADMVFVTAGMGGGTGTGAAPIIAEVAKDMGVLVVAVVTTPFSFERKKRATVAQEGIAKLREKVDALLVVENDKLLSQADDKTKSIDAFKMANEVLRQSVQGVTDLILKPGNINVDFADVRTIMRNSGAAIMGIGVGDGEDKAEKAAKAAIKSPLMSLPLKGAKGILFNIESAPDVALFDITKAANIINETAHEDAQVIWGHTLNEDLEDVIRITVIATGFSENVERSPLPQPSQPSQPNPIIKEPVKGLRLGKTRGNFFSFDETDLPSMGDEDMFMGTFKTPYDEPAIIRKKQK
ncbi:MAG: cell division protein FtsZ [Synergistaceae bacterium]|jgi:cell division protein FtsZ|nr:cell division protein FtsZ [Synergistaceae bacterium]